LTPPLKDQERMMLKSTLQQNTQKVCITMVLILAVVFATQAQHVSSEVDTLLSRMNDRNYSTIDSLRSIMLQLASINRIEKSELIDSKIKLVQVRILLAQNKPDSARLILNESESFFIDHPKYTNSRDHGLVLLSRVRFSSVMGEYGTAKVAALEARTIFQRLEKKQDEATALQALGNLGVETDNFEEAVKYYVEAQKLNFETHRALDASLSVNLALAYNQIGQYDAALKSMRNILGTKALGKFPPLGYVNLYSILASIHFNMRQYDSALIFHGKSRSTAVQLNIPEAIDLADFRLASFYSNTGDIRRSNAIAKKLLNSSHRESADNLFDVPLLLTRNYYTSGKFDSCILIGSSMLRRLGPNKTSEPGIQLSTLVANAFEKIHQRDSAIAYLQQSNALKDSVYGPTKQKEMSSLYAEIETLTKEKEIRLLKKEADVHEAENQILVISIVFGTSTTLLIVFLLLLNYRNRQKSHALLNYELQSQLDLRRNELHQQMLRIMYMNDGLSEIEEKLKRLKGAQPNHVQAIQQVLNTIHMNRTLEKEWDHFDNYFGSVHVGFFEKFNSRFPQLSITERRLAGLVRMNLTNTQIAGILNIEAKSVKVAKHRLKKKLELGEEDDLNTFLQSFEDNVLSVEN
jgi:tetratricopeptide (TPR) repeat protein